MSLFQYSGGIGQRTLLLFLIPLLIAVLGLGYRLTSTSLQEAQSALNERGELMVQQLAVISEFGLFSENLDELHRQAASVAQAPEVVHVAISNAAGNLLAEAGSIAQRDEQVRVTAFSAPVLRSSVIVSDFEGEEPDASVLESEAPVGLVQVSLATGALEKRSRIILLSGVLLTLCGLLVSFILAWLVARTVSVPIVRLTQTVGELTGGNLEARASTGSPGELGALEEGINLMASALNDARQGLVNDVEVATAKLQKTVSELEQRNHELEQAEEAALRAGNAKSDFLARMSHEIRTPLSAVIGFSRMLDSTELSETQGEYIRTISQAAAQSLVVIDDILGYTRLESGAPEMELIPFDLHESLENVVGILCESAFQKQLELVLYIHSDVPRNFSGDPNRINQVLTNLLSNAIKFTDSGHVVIEVAVEDAVDDSISVRFTVTDTGIGISQEQMGQIFDPFAQADPSTSRRYGGTGLGLSICQKLIRLMGGELQVESERGVGSKFGFSLSMSSMHDAPDYRPQRVLNALPVLIHDPNPFALRAVRNRLFTWGANVFYTPNLERMLAMLSPKAMQEQPFALLVVGLAPTRYASAMIEEICARVRQLSDIPMLLLVNGKIPEQLCSVGAIPDTAMLEKPPRSDRVLRAACRLIDLELSMTPSRGANGEQSALDTGLSDKDILVVEDNALNQQLMAHILSELDVRVTLAANGAEACLESGKRRFDAILMDIHMPVMGGFDATEKIRQGINHATPVIALTADVFADQGDYLTSRGIDDCLLKPVEPKQLAQTLRRWIGADRPAVAATSTSRDSSNVAVALPEGFRDRLLNDMSERLKALREATQSCNDLESSEQLHLLKGTIDYFELADFRDTFNRLQQAFDHGYREEASEHLDTLEALLGLEYGKFG